MGIFQGNILGGGESPWVAASRGEFFVPVGDEDHPPLARWLIIIFCALAVVISAALFVNRLYMQSITLPERSSAMIGDSIDEMDDVPESVTYAGVLFDYDVISFENIISGCSYTAKTNLDEMNAVIDSLFKCYGDPSEFDKIALSKLTKEEIAALGSAAWTWNYGKWPVESLEKLDGWGSNVAGYYINPTYLYMDLSVSTAEDGKVDIEIRYEVRPRY